mgnify:CR=1 FL=1
MKNYLKQLYRKLINDVTGKVHETVTVSASGMLSEQAGQLILKNQYRSIGINDVAGYRFEDIGFRKYSQNDEDGILLFIFSVIGTVNKTAVEVCASDGIQCNTANLIINHGWQALLFDGNARAVEKGTAFYRSHPGTFTLPPRFVHAWITKDNINNLIAGNGISGEIDLLSIDMDGVDYWIWEAIGCISPRVVVAEVQCIWGSGAAVTVPYADNFKTEFVNGFGIYSGGSINAFINLARKKDYRLIGFEKYGFNAFFMRNDVGSDAFPEANTDNYESIPFVKWAKDNFLHLVKDKPWQQV